MAVNEILIWPDLRLTKTSEKISEITDETRALASRMITIMREHGDSAGLAAPQIGISKRLFIVDIPPEDNNGNGTNGPEVFINPEFIVKEGQFTWQEGCLSIPGLQGQVTRAKRVVMKYLNEQGEEKTIEAFDYLSGCLQHEYDHLNGILWVDYQSKLKQEIVKKKMLKLIKERA